MHTPIYYASFKLDYQCYYLSIIVLPAKKQIGMFVYLCVRLMHETQSFNVRSICNYSWRE